MDDVELPDGFVVPGVTRTPLRATKAMRLLRENLLLARRNNTSASDAKGAKRIVLDALARIAPDSDLFHRMTKNWGPNPVLCVEG